MEKIAIDLTEDEEKIVEGDDNILAQLLLRKAIVKEMAVKVLTEAEENQLEKLKENLEVEYYLEKVTSKDVQINDIEVVKVYEENRDKFKDTKIEEAIPAIRQAIINKKLTDNKVTYLNGLVEKYNLNEKLKEYSQNSKLDIKKEVLNEAVNIKEENDIEKESK